MSLVSEVGEEGVGEEKTRNVSFGAGWGAPPVPCSDMIFPGEEKQVNMPGGLPDQTPAVDLGRPLESSGVGLNNARAGVLSPKFGVCWSRVGLGHRWSWLACSPAGNCRPPALGPPLRPAGRPAGCSLSPVPASQWLLLPSREAEERQTPRVVPSSSRPRRCHVLGAFERCGQTGEGPVAARLLPLRGSPGSRGGAGGEREGPDPRPAYQVICSCPAVPVAGCWGGGGHRPSGGPANG